MSNDIITLDLDERKATGKHVKALRRDGLVPANIYQRGEESQSVTAKFTEITKVYNAAGKHHLAHDWGGHANCLGATNQATPGLIQSPEQHRLPARAHL